MTMSDFNIAARRILCIALVLAPMFATNAACAQSAPIPVYGYHQSPIDIVNPLPDPNPLKFGNTDALKNKLALRLINTTGKEWCAKCDKATVDQRWGSLKAYPPDRYKLQIWYGGFSYTLDEFHFHAPAEHLVNGRLTEMELHFVFKKDQGASCGPDTLLVIGQRIVKGNANRELNKIFGESVKLPVDYPSGPTPVADFQISEVLGDLHSQGSYRYAGSLTAPADLMDACPNPPGNPSEQLASGYLPEIVQWVLLEPTIQMSPKQIAKFQKLFPNGDARGPQALHPELRRVMKAPPEK